MSSALCLQSLPPDILAMLPEFLYNIEDYTNLSSTCRIMRVTMATATPKQILRLAAAQSNVFFRPDPLFLVAATARELGNWARSSWDNEWEFIDGLEGVGGFEKILDLALKHCGLTLERIRELHLLRFSLINPAIETIDKCVGEQWRATQDFWNSSASDAWSINAEPAETLFHFIIYGELFGPDFEAFLDPASRAKVTSVSTRLDVTGRCLDHDHELAIAHVVNSSRWKSHWKKMRALAGPDFKENFFDEWSFSDDDPGDWKQRLWENVMLCQGLAGLEILRPHLRSS
jgi:hypothetical protein